MKKYFIRLWMFICTEVTIPTELSGIPHVSVLVMLILSKTVSTVCVLNQTLLSFNPFKCNCTESETQSDGP